MKPVQFFDVAEQLSGMNGAAAEGFGRSAVSRYYYAAFLEARDQLVDQRGLSFKTHESHENVKKAYYWADPTRVKKVGRLLEDLKKLLVSADYDLNRAFDPVAVGEAQTLSRHIRDELADPSFEFAACVDPGPKRGA